MSDHEAVNIAFCGNKSENSSVFRQSFLHLFDREHRWEDVRDTNAARGNKSQERFLTRRDFCELSKERRLTLFSGFVRWNRRHSGEFRVHGVRRFDRLGKVGIFE